MATKRQIEEQDLASDNRRNAACATLLQHAAVNDAADVPDKGRGVAVGVLSALVDAIEGEAADVRELRRKGWQSAAKTLDETVTVIKGWRDLLVEYTPPAGPRHEPLAEIAVDHRADSPADLDARLEAAFGIPPVERHIRTILEGQHPNDINNATAVYGNLCGAKTGSFTHPGGANCAECHARYAEQNDGKPYDGPMAFGNTVPIIVEPRMPDDTIAIISPPSPDGSFAGDAAVIKLDGTDVTGDVAAVNIPPRRDEPVTPTVARAIREEVEAEQVSEPLQRAIAEGRVIDLGDGAFAMAGEPGAGATVISPDTAAMHVTLDPRTGAAEVRPTPPGSLAADIAAVKAAHERPTEIRADLVPMALNIVEPTTAQARRRMTAAQVREHGQARRRGAEHRSVSQVESIGDCGTRYALSDLERPAWWNVGGKALHRAVETINRYATHAENTGTAGPDDSEILFLRAFDAEIADQHVATPEWHMSTWRAADRGRENYDFWRVEGPIMVQRWVAWLSRLLADGWTIATVGDTPVIEYETRLDVGTPVPNLSIIDLALLHQQQNVLLIVDAKAGKSAPKDTFQLGVYGWALLAAGIAGFTPTPDLSNVRGLYWRARTGEAHPASPLATGAFAGWPVLHMHPWPDVVQRYRDADALDRNAIYIPNVTSFCGGCGVADLCPAKASS